MKFVKLLFISFLIFSCREKPEKFESIIHEIPITQQEGTGDFYKSFGVISTTPNRDNFWAATRVEVGGIPDNWKDPVLKQIWFDARQFVYQNFKAGNIDSARFEDLKTSWNFDPSKENLTEKPIKSFTHIVTYTDKNGNIFYRIDTNNDRDFSDETTYSSVDETGISKSGKAQTHILSYETIRNDSVVQLETKFEIQPSQFGLMNHHPIHYTATFQDSLLQISNGFQSTEFKSVTSILVGKRNSLKKKTPIELDEYLKLDGRIYQNLGVDENKMVLRLKELPADSTLYSTQIGFPARPITGTEFSSDKQISLSDYRGKFVFLEFWGSWCAPCIQELPTHVEAYDRLDKSKIEFLGIAGNDNETDLANTLNKFNVKWPQILSDDIPNEYGIIGYPTSFLLDPNGIIVAKNLRAINFADTLNHYLNSYAFQ